MTSEETGNWQARARDEVLQVFGNNIPDFEDLNWLKIVTMILNEVPRLYTPGVMISRRVNQDTKLGELISTCWNDCLDAFNLATS
ncbi:unnamed protein product [Coffea canephora]|uniref:DH200=94 genomic scaffold, scaffold_566 n=1 Tax=Coffea canephora TaxID=49390 RepID=A0A068VGA0_COFCA|nr:unnamed protein product [Coffea canephora]